MLFSRFVSFFALSTMLGGLALAKPMTEKRDLTGVNNVVAGLKSSTGSILPEIKTLIENKNVTDATIAPLLNQLIAAVNSARTSLVKVPLSVPAMLEKRQDVSGVATLVAEIIEEVSTVLDDLLSVSASVPIIGTLIPELDAALTSLVTSLGILVTGLVTILSGLLATVSALLDSVGLGLLTGLLGLVGL